MFELFKKIEKVTENVETQVVEVDNTEALALALELQVVIPKVGDTVRVVESSVYDAGRMGVVKSIGDTISIQVSDEIIVVESNSVERLITMMDLQDDELKPVFNNVFESVSDILVLDGVNKDLLETTLVTDVIYQSLVYTSFSEFQNQELINTIVESIMKEFPRIKKGIVEPQRHYNILIGEKDE